MANLSTNPVNVRKSINAVENQRTCGEATGLQPGDLVYLDENDRDEDGVGKAKKADADASVGHADVDGVCVNYASLGQPITVVNSDPEFTPGATLVPGMIYAVARTPAGKIMPVNDLQTGDYVSPVGIAITSTTMNFSAQPTTILFNPTTTTTSTTTTTTTTTAS